MKRKRAVLLVVAVTVMAALIVGLAVPVMAASLAEEAPPAVPDLQTVLRLIAEGGVAGVVLSWLLENVMCFQKLTADQKRWGTFAVSLLLPVLAEVLLRFVPPEFWIALTPFWLALARGFIGWAGSQINYHAIIKGQGRRWQVLEGESWTDG